MVICVVLWFSAMHPWHDIDQIVKNRKALAFGGNLS
jgi:hypothetical protein